MLAPELINKIRQVKQDGGFTLHDLSKKIDVSVSTLERWLKTGRINKLYAQLVKEKLGIR
jgi:transcriptional regulator with XRE-family HTH domain